MATVNSSAHVLWIANLFPPVGGMQGLRMRHYLDEIARTEPGITIDVLTIRPTRRVPQYDPRLGECLPKAVSVYRFRPGVLYRLRHRWGMDRRLLSSHGRRKQIIQFAISASNLAWIPRAAIWVLFRSKRRYDAVYVFVDPFASLLPALLASLLNPRARLVLDYGDPKAPARDPVAPVRKAAARIEQYALERSYAASFRAPGAIELYEAAYPRVPPHRYQLSYGGVDWAAYDAVSPTEENSTFSVIYTGMIYPDTVDIKPFFEAVAHLANFSAEAIQVVLAGAEDPTMTKLTHELGLANVVVSLGHIPTHRVIGLQRSAGVLLSFGLWNRCKISSKLGEYIAARVPILYIAESPDDAGAELISKRSRGVVVPNNPDAIADAIRDLRLSWERGDLSHQFNLSRSGEFSWHEITSQLVGWLTGSDVDLTV